MKIYEMLEQFKQGKLSAEETARLLEEKSFVEIGHTKADISRPHRCGLPEIIFGEGKKENQLREIIIHYTKRNLPLLITRLPKKHIPWIERENSTVILNRVARTARWIEKEKAQKKKEEGLLICCAGTSDIPIAEEAKETSLFLGIHPEWVSDVGVAGIHRLMAHEKKLRSARVIITIAGMEGALPGVIAGLVSSPVIAVPTSVGYGVSQGGFAALACMLSSCSQGLAVMNIDNGVGAACLAKRILALRRNHEAIDNT